MRTEPSRHPLATAVPAGWKAMQRTASACRGRDSPRKRLMPAGKRVGRLGREKRARMKSDCASVSLPACKAWAARTARASARSISSGQVLVIAPEATAWARSARKSASICRAGPVRGSSCERTRAGRHMAKRAMATTSQTRAATVPGDLLTEVNRCHMACTPGKEQGNRFCQQHGNAALEQPFNLPQMRVVVESEPGMKCRRAICAILAPFG